MVKYRLYSLWSYLECLLHSWGISLWSKVHQKSFDRWFYRTYLPEYKRELEKRHGVKL